MILHMLVAAAAVQAPTPAPAPTAPTMPEWLAGSWVSCDGGYEVSEIWSRPRGAVMLGFSIMGGRRGISWEQTRIEATATGLVFHAQPSGQPGGSFPLLRAGPAELVFENRGHDFPQRVIYRREGNRLTGRIEGEINGQPRAMDWHYAQAPLNAPCPPPAGGRTNPD